MKRVVFIIAVGDGARANGSARASFDARGGERTFTTRLSPTGTEPATHLICSGLVPAGVEGVLSALAASCSGSAVAEWDWEGDKGKVTALLAEKGLKIVEPEIRPAKG